MMEQLDNVYCQHFRGEETLTLLDCFHIEDIEDGWKMFGMYMNAVMDALKEGGSSRTEEGPQKYGIREADRRAVSVLFPFEGRLNLPLATVSMLDDLKTCVLVDETVVTQVGGFFHSCSTSSLTNEPKHKVSLWFDGLASHMMATKGHDLSAHVWSDVIVNKLARMCPLDRENVQTERLALSVRLF